MSSHKPEMISLASAIGPPGGRLRFMTLRVGQTIRIGRDITVTVVAIQDTKVTLKIVSPETPSMRS